MENVRLVIWDMDETFWSGTLSEGHIDIPESNKKIVIELSKRGIVNSISSKNNYQDVKDVLVKEGIWDYFVFPRINWESKGSQVRWIIDSIKLRPATVLFIDDNPTNIEEVRFYNPEIQTSDPSIIPLILSHPLFGGKDDSSLSRLNQYKVLERKALDEVKAGSNEAFLRSSNIIVKIIEVDLLDQIDRIVELNQRTNQLNFTKNRLEKEEIENLLVDGEYRTGYVTVKDNYGEYGIVGFFAVKNGVLEHFCFSCRTIGLGVEQWVYYQLECPELTVVGEVVTELKPGFCPDWINNTNESEAINEHTASVDVLLLGGCDLEQTAYYLSQTDLNFQSRFNHFLDGRFDVHPESTELIRQSMELTNEQKQHLISQCLFYDGDIFENDLFKGKHDYIFYSPVIDLSLGRYHEKHTGLTVVYGNCDCPESLGHSYMSEEEYKAFRDQFDFDGRISPERFLENLCWIRDNLPNDTKITIINFSEINIPHPQEPERYLVHKAYNAVIDEFVKLYKNVDLIDIRKIVTKEEDHTDNIRHYSREIYYKIAQQILKTIEEDQGREIYSLENVKDLHIPMRKKIKQALRKVGLLDLAYRINSAIHK